MKIFPAIPCIYSLTLACSYMHVKITKSASAQNKCQTIKNLQSWKQELLSFRHYKGTRKFKLLDSNQIRQMRECCLFELNGMEVFL